MEILKKIGKICFVLLVAIALVVDGLFIYYHFFVKENDLYSRFSEEFSEKAYTERALCDALENAGLEIVEIFDDMTEKPLNDNSQRAIYVTKKVK